MVSNKEQKKRLEVRRKDTKAQDIILEPTESANGDSNLVCPDCGTVNLSISNFCSECGNPIELKPPGYVVCDVCYGIYELEEGESPEDFVNSQCQCGGNLTYIQESMNSKAEEKIVLLLDKLNPYHVKKCENVADFLILVNILNHYCMISKLRITF
jgi:NMD protein affecting ribosome stability and mRNA decay